MYQLLNSVLYAVYIDWNNSMFSPGACPNKDIKGMVVHEESTGDRMFLTIDDDVSRMECVASM